MAHVSIPTLLPLVLPLTQHLADVRLNVHILQVLMGVGMVEPESRVQADRHPHPITNPCQLPNLALPPWMGIK